MPNSLTTDTQMIRAPDFSAFLGYDYGIPNGDGGFLFAGNLKYTDSYAVSNPSLWGRRLIGTQYADRAGDQRFRQGSYFLLKRFGDLDQSDRLLYAPLWGTNLTDTIYILHYSGSASNDTYSPIAARQSYGVTLGYKSRQ